MTVETTLPPVPITDETKKALRTAGRKAQEWVEERDRLIKQARSQGASLREIAELVGISHSDKQGYGKIGLEKYKAPALVHRVAYEHYHGPIPASYEVDHTCFVYNCVNPDHLEAITYLENIRRRNERQGWKTT